MLHLLKVAQRQKKKKKKKEKRKKGSIKHVPQI